ncbi:MAG: transposase [Gammaproteobacteria bacterium]|nr:transposase [Gammaproteobacteria bacterium]
MTDRHRSKEFLSFMEHVEKNTPKDQELHIILDNLSAHKITMIMDWVDSHPHVHFYFTLTSSSWWKVGLLSWNVEHFIEECSPALKN